MNCFQFDFYSNTLWSSRDSIDILWVRVLLTGVNRTKIQRVSNTREEPKPCWENKGKARCTESRSINLWQNTSGFDSSVLNSNVKDSAQQSSKYSHCSSVSVEDNCNGRGRENTNTIFILRPLASWLTLFLMYSCYCEECWEMDGKRSPVGDMCLLQAQCSHSHASPVSNLQQWQ